MQSIRLPENTRNVVLVMNLIAIPIERGSCDINISVGSAVNTGDHSAKNRRNFPSHEHKCHTVRT